ncbi:Gfo/Idh/MocA family protein [Saccharopolyspora sp. NPDC000995]
MARTDSMRVAVVGYGYWGSKHVRVLSTLPGVEVVVVDQDLGRLAEAHLNFPAAGTARALDEVLPSVHAVVVATPPCSHAQIALRSVLAGKHTLVEKPLATSIEDARRLVDTAAERGVVLMAGHTFEYNAAVWKLKEIIDSGDLGRVLYIDTARLNLGLYQRDVNVIWDLAPHDLSIIAFLMDETPASVTTWAHHHVDGRHADVAHVRLELEKSGTYAFVHVSWLNPQKVRRVTVVGDQKMAVYDDTSDEDRIRVYDIGVDSHGLDDPADAHAMPITYRSGDIVSPHVVFREPLLVQDTHFIDCARTGRTPNTSGRSGLEIVRVLSASDLAEVTGRPVRVLDVPAQRSPDDVEAARLLAEPAAYGEAVQ